MAENVNFQEFEKEVVALTQDLVRIDSQNPPGDEREIADFVAAYLNDAGLELEFLEELPTRRSIYATLKGSGSKDALMLSGHIDTVPAGAGPWDHGALDAKIVDGRIWGRGTADMKSGVAVIMAVAKALAQSSAPREADLILAITAGEESANLGAEDMARNLDFPKVQGLYITEPTSNEIFVAEKGALWVDVTTYGKTAHGSMPELGENAIMMMVDFINAFTAEDFPNLKDELVGSFSRSINMIQGGVGPNVVADQCTLSIDMRTVPGQNHKEVLAQIEAIFARLKAKNPAFNAKLEMTLDNLPFRTANEEPLVLAINEGIKAVRGKGSEPAGIRYATDGAVFLAKVPEMPIVICGPGSPAQAHQPNEHVEVREIVESFHIYYQTCAKLLA